MSTLTTVVVPDLGDAKAVDVIEILVQVNDVVMVDAPLITVETEKATMDVPCTVAGTVVALLVKQGDKVSAGAPVAQIAVSEAASGVLAPTAVTAPVVSTPVVAPMSQPVSVSPSVAPPAAAGSSVAAARRAVAISEVGFARAYAGPSVRLLARELGVDLGRVSGTGVKQRITHADVKAWVKRALSEGTGTAALPAVPRVDFARFGAIDIVPLSRIQKISGRRLHAAWVNLPHVTQFDVADITELEAKRMSLKEKAGAQGIKLTVLSFVLKACALVLAKYPRFAASLDESGENLVMKKYLHLGFAADTPNGLMVPVLRDANQKNVFEIARELASLSEKGRVGKLTASEMQGGCFTVSSLGGVGGTAFTPIINAPEVAILGVSRASMQPVYQGTAFVPRLMLPLSLSYDHRVIDGAEAARFTTALARALSDVAVLTEGIS
jgi:pyruvate dehydrogenase E2 component (dihydrolipoamide acetyltransferase)